MKQYEIRVAQNEEDIEAAFALRQLVFVEEKQLFHHDDRDDADSRALYINAWKEDQLIGTVRCYPDPQDKSIWWGGRLAVHPAYRGGVGVYLIRAAVQLVKQQHASQFLANILSSNVGLFKKMGWVTIGEPFEAFGQPHQLMEVDLYVQDALSLQYTGRSYSTAAGRS